MLCIRAWVRRGVARDRDIENSCVRCIPGVARLGVDGGTAVPLLDGVAVNDSGQCTGRAVVLNANPTALSAARVGNRPVADEVVRHLSLPGAAAVPLVDVDGTTSNGANQRGDRAAVIRDV